MLTLLSRIRGLQTRWRQGCRFATMLAPRTWDPLVGNSTASHYPGGDVKRTWTGDIGPRLHLPSGGWR